jgi:hypothetical protein
MKRNLLSSIVYQNHYVNSVTGFYFLRDLIRDRIISQPTLTKRIKVIRAIIVFSHKKVKINPPFLPFIPIKNQ